jgi:tripartite-type tricarboxylate transporter receptor subunit TctC
VVGRPFAGVLDPIIKQPVVIEAKVGAAGQVGGQFAANAKPDGYTLLLHLMSISGFEAVDKLFGRKPKFTRADFIRIARFTQGPMVLIVNAKTPYKTLKTSSPTPRSGPTRSFSLPPASTARCTCRRCCSPRRRESRCGICRPMAAARR